MKLEYLQEHGDDCENNVTGGDSEKFHFKDDPERFHAPLIGHVRPNRYCYCGRLRSMYADRISKLNPNLNLGDGLRHTRSNLSNDVLELSNGAVCVTKRSLMLNQFLESSERSSANTATTEKDSIQGNRFHPPTSIPANNRRYREDSLSVTVAHEGREDEGGVRSMCSNSILSDKRLVSLFRSVALYWFFCLNTLLVKSDLLKKKTFASDCGGDRTLTSFSDSGELKFQVLSIVSDCFEEDVDCEVLCAMILDALREDEKAAVRNREHLPFTDHARRKVNLHSTTDAHFRQFIRVFRRHWLNSTADATITVNDVRRIANVTNEIVLQRSVSISYLGENCRIEIRISTSSEGESWKCSNTVNDRIPPVFVPHQLSVAVCKRDGKEEVEGEEKENLSVEATIDFESESIQVQAIEDGWSKDVAQETVNEQTNVKNVLLRKRFLKFGSTNDNDENDDDDDDDDDETNSTCSSHSSELNSSYSLKYDSSTMSDGECLLGEDYESGTDHFEEVEKNSDEEANRLVQQEEQQHRQENVTAISYAQMCSVIPRGILEDDVAFVREYKMWKSPNIFEDYLKRTRSMEPTPISEKEIPANSPPSYQLFAPSKVGCDTWFSIQMTGKSSENCQPNAFCMLGEDRRQMDQNFAVHDTRPAGNAQQNDIHVINENHAQDDQREAASPTVKYIEGRRKQAREYSSPTANSTEEGLDNQPEVVVGEIRQQFINKPAKEYKMWESPVFVTCLPELARLLHTAGNENTSLSITRSFRDFQSTSRLSEIPSSSTTIGDLRRQSVDSNFTTMRGDEFSFTDGGAFTYYNRTFLNTTMKNMLSFSPVPACKYEDSEERISVNVRPDNEDEDDSDNDGSDREAIIRSVKKSEDDELERHKLNKDYYFRPIHPAYKVSTDPVPAVVRSISGSMYLGDRKYMTYKHELDASFTSAFQPKFELRSNDFASQTNDNQRIHFDLDLDFSRKDEATAHKGRIYATEPVVKSVQPSEHDSNCQDAVANVLHYLERSVLAGIDADMALAAYGYMDADTFEYIDPTSAPRYSNTVAADFQRC